MGAKSYDALDVSLHDDERAAEIELAVRLMLAASEWGEGSEHLTQQEIDRVLISLAEA